jgi:hypothetical protein
MNFAPAENVGAPGADASQFPEKNNAAFRVRWNQNAKRYQSYDTSHERFLNEIPSLEIPESTLK